MTFTMLSSTHPFRIVLNGLNGIEWIGLRICMQLAFNCMRQLVWLLIQSGIHMSSQTAYLSSYQSPFNCLHYDTNVGTVCTCTWTQLQRNFSCFVLYLFKSDLHQIAGNNKHKCVSQTQPQGSQDCTLIFDLSCACAIHLKVQ